MGKNILLAVLFGLSMAVSSLSQAAEPAKTVRFCFNNWAPYAVADAKGTHGISVEILVEAAKRAGLNATFEELPWNRCLEMVRQGKLDAVMDAAERDEFLQGPVGYVVYSNTLWVREADYRDGMTLEDLAGKRVGLVDGYVYPDGFLDLLKTKSMPLEYSVDDEQNIQKLAFSRVDAIVADFVSTLLFARERGLKIRALVPAHSFDRLYPSFSREREELHRLIDRSLDEMMKDGSINRIYRAQIGIGIDEALGR